MPKKPVDYDDEPLSDEELSEVPCSDESGHEIDEDQSEVESIDEMQITAELEFIDPHVEKNFSTLGLSSDMESSSWTTLPSKEDERIEKILGISESRAEAIRAFTPKFKPKLQEAWKKSVEAESDEPDDLFLPIQQDILGPLSMYQDVYVMDSTHQSEEEYRRVVLLHAMNHVMKIRDRILHHNQISAIAVANGKCMEDDDVMRDQGFTRPRVLILCPMRNVAYDLIQMIGELWSLTGAKIDGMKRFEGEFGQPVDEDGDLVEEAGPDPSKSDDFNRTFRGNIDDCFRIGLKFTRKTMKLFSDFYSSDIIIASPLGLRLVIDGQKEKVPKGAKHAKAKRARKADSDFLSSINICLIDGMDVLSMQNWEHLEYVLAHVNSMPAEAHDCDFSRVQTAYLDGYARKIRQTICLSKFVFPELNALLSNKNFIENYLGRWRFEATYSSIVAKKTKLFIDSQFHFFKTKSLESQSEDRLSFFTTKILPKYAKEDHICIFISSYFDFCQLKQWFASSSIYSFACLSEYEEGGAITGARSKFFNGHAKFLLITERFHFYRRLRIRGVKHLLWYSLPDHQDYFSECAEWVGDIFKRPKDSEKVEKRAPKTESPILYSVFDYLKLERIVGSSMIDKLL